MSNLSLKSICKSYGSAAVLKNITLEIDSGEFVVFVGPSGCGKSTLLKLIAGLEDITSGGLEIGNRDVSGLEPVERGIAMVFQSYALYPHLTVYNNIAFPLRLQKMRKPEIDTAVRKTAAILDLTDKLDFKPSQLSGGQQQRVAIGRAIIRNPEVFLFDEPLSNLDAALRGQMRVELTELHQKLEATMIYVTHDQVEAMTMADRIVVLRDGKIEQFGTPMQLYNRPRTRFVAGFIGQPGMNFIAGKVTGIGDGSVEVRTGSGDQVSLAINPGNLRDGDPVEIGIRPEFFSFSENRQGMEISIKLVERLGGITHIHGALTDGTRVIATLDGQTKPPEAGQFHLVFDPIHAHLFGSDGMALQKPDTPISASGA